MEIEDLIISLLLESRYFPLSADELARATKKRSNFIQPVLDTLVRNKQLLLVSHDQFFHLENLKRTEGKIVDTLNNFHRNYPYLQGMKKSDLRKALNNKKGQNNIHEYIFETALANLLQPGTICCEDFYYKIASQQAQTDSRYESHSETILNFFNFRQDLNRICQLSTLADNLKIDSRHLRNIMENLLKSGEIIKLYENMYIGKLHLKRLQDEVVLFIRQQGLITTLEAKDLFKGPRKTTIAILEYFDEIGITVRNDSNRTLNITK